MDFSKMSDEELEQLIASNEKPQQKEQGWLDKAGNYAGKFNNIVESSHLPEFAGGLLQGAGDIGTSLGNVIARPLGHPIPHPNLSQYINKSPVSRLAFGAGELGSQIPLYSMGAGALGKLGLTAEAGLSGRVAEGLVSGALMGENDEGGRIGGAAMGAAVPLAGKAIQSLSKLKSSNIAKNVTEGYTKATNESSKQFKDVFKAANERGVGTLSNKFNAKFNLLKKTGDKKYLHALEEFYKNPTLANAHEAQSNLAKYAYKIGKADNALDRRAKEEATRLSNKIREKMFNKFHKTGNLDLALKYNDARQFYKEGVTPYLNSKAFQKLQSGELRPKNFANKIQEDEAFISKIGQHDHPEIEYRRLLKNALGNKAVQYGIGTGLGALGLYETSKFFK